jgi:hypothetical protein
MSRKIVLWLLWLGFISYTLFLAPLDQPGNLRLVQKLVTLQWADINPILVVIFSLMGVWPMIYACLMFVDGRMQNIPAWPSFLASNGAGAIGLLPYLILRESNQQFSGQKDIWLKILDSRWTGVSLSLSTAGLLAYAWLAGDWQDFIYQWHSNHFVNAISLDFCLMCLLFPSLLGDDMARRGLRDSRIFWLVTLVPLFGPLAYLCLRPPLPEPRAELGWT